MPSSTPILTVSQLTLELKQILENRYRFVRISGEISNLKTPFSGHSYFTLKDSGAQLQAVLFKNKKRFLAMDLKDGQEVICFGQISVYEPRGNYQLVVDSVEPAGDGQLQLKFEQLKQKLSAQGYFAEEKKVPLPQFPREIAVISSPTAAAFADFLKIARQRESSAHIQLYPVRVQGNEAAGEIAQAIARLDKLARHDIIVLIRGGGSLEDLWAFNEEIVADAIFHARLPIVTGVGHEIDFTIADFCADYRCPTPTAVAETLIPDKTGLRLQLQSAVKRLSHLMQMKLLIADRRLGVCTQGLEKIHRNIERAEQRLEMSRALLIQTMDDMLAEKELAVTRLQHKLQLLSPVTAIKLKDNTLENLRQRLSTAIQNYLNKQENALARQASLLHSVSPLATLARGYSITRKKDKGSIIREMEEVEKGERVEILLHKGVLECEVKNTHSS